MSARVVRLDVRPILASGRDPFVQIMQAAAGVPANGVMIVIAPFDPIPLREVLAGSGFTSAAMPRGPREWEITFRRSAGNVAGDIPRAVRAETAPLVPAREPGPAQVCTAWTDDGNIHADVRGLDSGPALQAILVALDAITDARTLVVHLDSNIDALYPELARRGCEAVFVPGERAEVRLEISPSR